MVKYILSGLTVSKFLKVQKMAMIQSRNISTMNMLKRKMKYQMTKEVKMETVMVMMMMIMMIWMIMTDEHHAPLFTMT